jgi:putative heme iron utilization protein
LLATSLEGTDDLITAEAQMLTLVNARHQAALAQFAAALAGKADAPWRAIGTDPEGLDLAFGEVTARIVFRGPSTPARNFSRHFLALSKPRGARQAARRPALEAWRK